MRKYHISMLGLTAGTAFGAPIGIILVYSWGPQIDDLGNALAYWMLTIGPVAAAILLVVYFLFLLGVVAWVQIKQRNRHDH